METQKIKGYLTVLVQFLLLLLYELFTLLAYSLKSPNKIDTLFKLRTVDTFTGLIIIILLSVTYGFLLKNKRALGRKIQILLGASLIFSILWEILFRTVLTIFQLTQFPIIRSAKILLVFGSLNFFVVFSLSVVYLFIQYLQQLKMQEQKTSNANALAREAQLKMLRYQLNPHFLFNALNSVRALIEEDKTVARKMITQLSEFMRYSLVDGEKKEVPLKAEIDAITNYLSIQKIRFEENLQVEIHTDEAALNVSIPFFLIHPLVENALKYGMQTSPRPLQIKVEAKLEETGKLSIVVANTGKLEPVQSAAIMEQNGNTVNGTGTGLKNIRQRLDLLCPGEYDFSIEEKEGWVWAKMKFSLSRDKK